MMMILQNQLELQNSSREEIGHIAALVTSWMMAKQQTNIF